MGGEIIRRGPRRFGQIELDKAKVKRKRRIVEGNVRRRTEPFVLSMRGWEARGARQYHAPVDIERGKPREERVNGRMSVKLLECIEMESIRDLEAKAEGFHSWGEKGALILLKRQAGIIVGLERIRGLKNGSEVPTIDELASVHIALAGCRDRETGEYLLRILKNAIRKGKGRVRSAADECLDALLETGVLEHRV